MQHAIEEAILELASAQHGVVGRWQLVCAGVPATLIDDRVRRGRLERLQRCVYRVRGLTGARTHVAATVLSFGPHAVASHRTAGEVQALLVRPPATQSAPVVSVRQGHPLQRPGAVLHRVRMADDERCVCDGIPATSPARTLLDLAAELEERALEQVIAAALRAGLATEAGIVRLLTRYPRRAGSPRLMALLRDDAPPAFTRSEAEGRFLQLVRRAGLPAPAVNTLVCGFEVDFCWIMHKLVVEIDGLAYHSTRAAQRRDRRRDATLTASGWRVLRFSWDDVTQRPEATLAKLVLALARGGL